jgi:hypothetical protein
MKMKLVVFGMFALSSLMIAQTNIPVGTIIPVVLNSSLDARSAKPGQTVTAKVAQDVPLDNGARIKAGTRVIGEVMAVNPAGNSEPASIALRFDKIDIAGRMQPIVTNLRALASPLEVWSAQTQVSGDERGSTPAWSQTVTLIGGDVEYREAGTVENGSGPVGKSVYAGDWGVLSQVVASPGKECRGAVQGNDKEQALWVFSHDACGTYGVDAVITQAGRTSKDGRIVVASTGGDLKLRSGSAMLLRVNSENAGMASN